MAAHQPTEEVTSVELHLIAHDPDNPVARHEVDPELVASIRSVGVLQPVVLVPVEVWLTNRPDHRDQLTGEAMYVAWLGNRRVANARAADRQDVPAVIRQRVPSLAQSTGRIHENVLRRGLAPTEEATSLRRALDQHEDLTQRSLASHLGMSEPRISKLLQLLRLPAGAQQRVDDRALPLEAALSLLREDEQVREQVGRTLGSLAAAEGKIDLNRLVRDARRALTEDREDVGSEQPAPSPPAADPASAASPPSPSPSPSGDAPQPSSLREGAVGEDGAEREVPPPAPPASDADDSQDRPVDDVSASAAAREEGLLDLARRPAASGAQTGAVAAAWLTTGWGPAHRDLGRRLLLEAGLGSLGQALDTPDWATAVAATSTRKALLAGWLLTLAVQEISTRQATSWGPAEAAYLRTLIEHGYSPTDGDLRRLEAADGRITR